MFAQNLQQVAQGGRVFDVCVIGTGPAGMTVATELAARDHTVLLLEAGPMHFDEASQQLYAGEVVGPLPFALEVVRLRCFGGSSNHWGGWCRPLDPVDFEPKVAGVDTAWPIGRADLDPYLARAARVLELSPRDSDRPFGDRLQHLQFMYSPPVSFARKFQPVLERDRRITTVLQACVTGFEERNGRVIALDVRDPANTRHQLRARRYVLCAGGIENSRLLLWANQRSSGRIVKEPAALGRYWLEHPHFTIGEALINEGPPFRFDEKGIAFVSPTAQALREKGLLNVGLRLYKNDRQSTRRLIENLICVAPRLGSWAAAKAGRQHLCGVRVRAAWEQAPRWHNRVVLGAASDRFGIPRAELHWRLDEFDRRTVRRAAQIFGEELVRSGLGRMRIHPWLRRPDEPFPRNDEVRGNHHMGGTRMSTDPRNGVVDVDCKVHGLANLYVCGSSVFPSAGHANPTFTIVQLALRLADHLHGATSFAAVA